MAIHRLRQGLRALFAFSQPIDYPLAEHYLSPEQMTLFRQMRPSEQLHSLHVLRAVLAQGNTPLDLAVAALLHDVGKSRYPLALWQKTAVVLVRAFIPAIYRRLSAGDPRRLWVRPFAVYAHHPAWSAQLLTQNGASPAAIWLVEQHQNPADNQRDHDLYPLLERLQQADDTN